MMTTSAPWMGLFQDHPIRPLGVQDPLELLPLSVRDVMGGHTTRSHRPRIAFACQWEEPPERTWSGSATRLRSALDLITDTSDIGVSIPATSRAILKAIHIRHRGGRLTTTWSYSRLTDAYDARALRGELIRKVHTHSPDAILMIDSLAVLSLPFFVYYDSSWDSWIAAAGGTEAYAALKLIKPSTVERRRQRQVAVYERATGVIAMSRWLARSLVEQSGVPASKVHVVHPGISTGWASQRGNGAADREPKPQFPLCLPVRPAPRRRLLFVGRQYKPWDFYRKGGDLVVAALEVLRRDYDPGITLTIAGVNRWPLPGGPPEGVRLLGALPRDRIAALYDSHDLLVMPSRMEPFGIVFIEALARGLPCIARYAYAMPEIVTPGLSGALINNDNKHELASTIAATLADDELYHACRVRAPAVATYFSWERAASQITQIIAQSLGSLTPMPRK